MSPLREELHRLIDELPDSALPKVREILERFLERSKAGIRTVVIEINGCVETTVSEDQWTDDFIEWLESRGEYFGGGTKDVSGEDTE